MHLITIFESFQPEDISPKNKYEFIYSYNIPDIFYSYNTETEDFDYEGFEERLNQLFTGHYCLFKGIENRLYDGDYDNLEEIQGIVIEVEVQTSFYVEDTEVIFYVNDKVYNVQAQTNVKVFTNQRRGLKRPDLDPYDEDDWDF